MEKIYQKLNDYLNDICVYLEKEDSFLLENIRQISWLNDITLKHIENSNNFNDIILKSESKTNKLTFEEVFLLAREIIASIDASYVKCFDNLIKSGELDFGYENEYDDSVFISIFKKGHIKKIININREFNYNDVVSLIHEFIHFTNSGFSVVRHYFTEFLSIYFEFYTVDFLIKKGIDVSEIDAFKRIKSTYYRMKRLTWYELPLLAYINFGNLSSDTYLLLKKYILNIKKEAFENECKYLYSKLTQIAESEQEKICINSFDKGYYLSRGFIINDYRYILGTLLALYALKFCEFTKIVYLNNHINEFEGKSVYEICLFIGIDLNAYNFKEKLFLAINEFINGMNIEVNRKI